MIKFFRKIRQNMIKENNVSKYLLYAIGEIVLVVIGILIALQINNYSERSKERQTEVTLLSNLSSEVDLDIKQIENNTIQSDTRLKRLDSLLQLLKTPNKIDKMSFLRSSYDFIFDNYFKANSGIFDEAVSSGKMSFIQNEPLRQAVFNYYRVVKGSYTDGTTRQITDEVITPLFVETLFLNQEGFSVIATDVEGISNLEYLNMTKLANNKDFWKMTLLKFGGNREQMIKWAVLKTSAEKLKMEIDQELDILKKK